MKILCPTYVVNCHNFTLYTGWYQEKKYKNWLQATCDSVSALKTVGKSTQRASAEILISNHIMLVSENDGIIIFFLLLYKYQKNKHLYLKSNAFQFS